MRKLAIFILLAGLSACVSSWDVDRPNQLSKRMDPSVTAYVSVPPDAALGKTHYRGSGLMVATAVATAFGHHMRQVDVASGPQTYDAALEAARQSGAAYLIAPDILIWEDRSGHWSGRTDWARIEISVVEVATGDVIETAVVGATSGFSAMFRDAHPQDLLKKPVRSYVDSLFPGQS